MDLPTQERLNYLTRENLQLRQDFKALHSRFDALLDLVGQVVEKSDIPPEAFNEDRRVLIELLTICPPTKKVAA